MSTLTQSAASSSSFQRSNSLADEQDGGGRRQSDDEFDESEARRGVRSRTVSRNLLQPQQDENDNEEPEENEDDASLQALESLSGSTKKRRNQRLAAQKVDKYDMDEEEEEGLGRRLEGSESDQNMEEDEDEGDDDVDPEADDRDDDMEEGDNGDEGDQEEDKDQDGNNVPNSAALDAAKQMPADARESLRKSREMVDSGLNQLYQLKLKELEAEEELINQKSHPEYHTKLAHLLEKKERNLKRAQDRLAFVTENFKKTLDCCIQEASETLSSSKRKIRTQFVNSITRDRFNFSSILTNPYEKDQAFILSAKIVREKKRARMDDFVEGLGHDSEIPSWALHLLKKRHRAGFDNLWSPNFCLGLDNNEVEEDLAFLKTVIKVGEKCTEPAHANGVNGNHSKP